MKEKLMTRNVQETCRLRRTLGPVLLVFYGLGIIIGAGVYVVVGDVIKAAGTGAIISFILAGMLAAMTALSYAELSVRYPEAAGAAAYVEEAFKSNILSRLTGLAVAAVTLVTAATIACGTAIYAKTFVPLPDALLAGFTVILFTGIACLGVKDSVRAAAVMTVIELAGLIMVIGFGLSAHGMPAEIITFDSIGLNQILAGAFLAFFAFTGFENLANMAEEAKDTRRTIPYAILISLAISTVFYLMIVAVVGAALPSEETAVSSSLLSVFEHSGKGVSEGFSLIALIAVSNGVLIQILMLSRLFYGMACRSLLPGWLSRTNSQQVPVNATIVAGLLTLVSTVALPFKSLLYLSTTLTLIIFALVGLSLWRLKLIAPIHDLSFKIPLWVPVIAAFGNVCLIFAQFLN